MKSYFHNLTNDKTFIIAEACDNHMGSIDVAKEMALMAKISGASAIKFQHHLPDEEMLPNLPMSSNFGEPLYDFLIKNALSLNDHIDLKHYCDQIEIQYLCTPFSYRAAEEIFPLVNFFKIGSGELSDHPSLKKISLLGKPMLLSTGMSTFKEITTTINILKNDTDIAILNCISEYPPIYEDMNLLNISKLIELFPEILVGHSDHSPDLYTSFAAVTLGAKIIEKHVIIDKKTPGPDQAVSIDFKDLYQLVDGIRKIELSLRSSKKVFEKEKEIRTWAHRSVVSITDINKDEIISENNIWTKRPGTGIPSKDFDKLIGKKAKKFIKKNTIVSWDMFS
jgi:N,N'-diacetyllegionaminate synthase